MVHTTLEGVGKRCLWRWSRKEQSRHLGKPLFGSLRKGFFSRCQALTNEPSGRLPMQVANPPTYQTHSRKKRRHSPVRHGMFRSPFPLQRAACFELEWIRHVRMVRSTDPEHIAHDQSRVLDSKAPDQRRTGRLNDRQPDNLTS